MKFRRLFLLTGLLLGPAASAQFFQAGNDPSGRWSEMGTAHYRIVYPEGMDSLARAYVLDLERWRPSVGLSAGEVPGGRHWGRLPVILHPHYPYSNGSVAWAPKRMDLYTRPDPYGSLPQAWMTQLSVHESRHVSQMQLAYRRPFKWVNYLVGEMWSGAVAGLYTPPVLLEGDAVVAETALTASGRGRSADFLNYYHVAYDNGDWRDWYKWVYGSFKHAGPDYYTVGYMTVAGMRTFYDRPSFTADYFDRVCRHPFPAASLQRYVKSLSGKSFRKTWQDIQECYHAMWTEEADARGPFMPMVQVTRKPAYATDYSAGSWVDGNYYAIKVGKTTARRLVRIDPDGTEHDMGAFAADASSFFPGEERIYWTETIPGRRWTLDGESVIRYMDPDGRHRGDLTREGRLYNPQPGPDGVLATVEYPVSGGSNLLMVSEKDGSILSRTSAPEGVQLTESAWIGDDLYCIGLDECGFGIWRLREGRWTCTLAPSIQTMENLNGGDGCLELVSDRSGVKELYRFDPLSGKAWQLTNSRYGGNDYSRSEDGEIWFSSQTPEGLAIFRSPEQEPVEVDLREVHRYRDAETLSQQERAFAAAPADTAVSAPRPYRKALHLVKFHSWTPFWFSYDNLSSLSLDNPFDAAAPGVLGLFQNDLGTAWGTVGYAAAPHEGKWRHSGHLQFTYTGLYPVLEGSFDLYGSGAQQSSFQRRKRTSGLSYAILTEAADGPAWNGGLRAYVPLRFNKGGIQSGVVPQVSWNISGSRFRTGLVDLTATEDLVSGKDHLAFTGYTPGGNILMQSVRGSVRGYRMLPVAKSLVYPRWGVGAELGGSFRPGLTEVYSPVWYGYLYGYLPGFTRTQGLRLTAMGQAQAPTGAPFGENSVNVWPRGFSAAEARSIARRSARQLCLTADYAIPLYVGDLSWFSPVAYISHLLAVPHFDWMVFGGARNGRGSPAASSLWSAGVDLTVELGNLLWVPYPCSVGVSATWQGGAYYEQILEVTKDRKPYSVELIFSFDI